MSVKKNIENLISLYKQNISDNKYRINEYFKKDPEMKQKLENENSCLLDVISELKEAIKLKSEK